MLFAFGGGAFSNSSALESRNDAEKIHEMSVEEADDLGERALIKGTHLKMHVEKHDR
jgi:hypothetical protein